MYSFFKLILLYPYPYKTFAAIVTAIMLAAIALPLYGFYRLVIRKMTEKAKATFHKILTITGIVLLVIFFAEGVFTLITEHQVNKQLGFGYATPDTPEGEFFVITKVVPGGIMDKAGLRPDDRVLMQATSDLYKLLIDSQGLEASFLVLRNKKKVTIKLKVPEMELPLRKMVFLF
jgi:predicted metalloprotease with PDZ domain